VDHEQSARARHRNRAMTFGHVAALKVLRQLMSRSEAGLALGDSATRRRRQKSSAVRPKDAHVEEVPLHPP
jgi:hypothetical protein